MAGTALTEQHGQGDGLLLTLLKRRSSPSGLPDLNIVLASKSRSIAADMADNLERSSGNGVRRCMVSTLEQNKIVVVMLLLNTAYDEDAAATTIITIIHHH